MDNIPGLRFVCDDVAGISRKRLKDKFHYFDKDGNRVKDKLEIQRIQALAIPPAWTNVWICCVKNGHVQATGRDARLRKQYRYHSLWRKTRDEAKYEHMISFGQSLPAIRQAVTKALALPGLPQEKVLATVIYLLQLTMIRIGNDEYAKQNKSYGLTTLRNRHIQIDGSEVQFQFKGKSGVNHSITVSDKKLASLIKKIRELPGQELFQYVDDQGKRHAISSSEVNEYIRNVTGENYTAKDFRTWFGTIETAIQLIKFESFTSETQAKKNVADAIKVVAKKLGNTATICRKCYVHPSVIASYLDGSLTTLMPKLINKKTGKLIAHDKMTENRISSALSVEEEAILEFLQRNKT
ncbi:MAG: DNA topoisomerase IB [Pseudomonadota bacterium]